MSDPMSLFSKLIDGYRTKTDRFRYLVDKDKKVADAIINIYHKYMSLPKFSDIIKEDPRKYKTYYCEGGNVFSRILKKYKFYEILDKDDNWDIYVPSGYNRIEIELEHLKPTSDHQIIFGIEGCDNLVGKTWLWNILEKTYGRNKAATLLPETFVLVNEEHVKLFEERYKEGEIYILKKRKQRKEGIQLTRDIEEIRKAKDNEFTLVQEYKRNLLLVNKRKLNLRIYLLLTFKNRVLEGYINKYGTCIYSNKEYDDSTLDFENNITSYNLDLKVYDDNPMTMKQLKTYLLDNGYKNPNILFERINEKMRLVLDAVKPYFGEHRNLDDNLCVQIFGTDFIVDKDLNPYLLECNKGPDMSPKEDSTFDKLIFSLEDFYMAENLVEKCYPVGYKSGNGLKVQRDVFELLNLIKTKTKNNGFYKIY
jgi:hypothetical protein